MTKKIVEKEIFLPKWQRWYVGPLFIFLIGLFTYIEFLSPDESEKMGLIPYILMVVLMLFILGIMWSMTTGKLPAHIIREKHEE